MTARATRASITRLMAQGPSVTSPSILQALLDTGMGSAGQRVAVALRRAVTLRLFKEDQLPPERDLAQLLGVSRITVREALAILRDEGHVRSFSGRGGGTYQVLFPMEQDWRARAPESWEQLMTVLTFRMVIEPPCARMVAERTNEALLHALHESAEEMSRARTLEEFRHADSEFHVWIAEATGNPRLLQTVSVARADFLMWRDRLIGTAFDPTDNSMEHVRILDALTAGDGDRAEGAMRTHLASAMDDFRRFMRRIGYRIIGGRLRAIGTKQQADLAGPETEWGLRRAP